MAKVQLTDFQQAQITNAASALPHPEAFTARVHELLEGEPEIGDGLVFRVCRSVQRELWAPPIDGVDRGFRRAQQLRKLNGRR